MAHYAQLDENNTVVNVFVGKEELVDGIDDWEIYYATPGFTVKKTSYNTYGNQHKLGGTPFRGNYAVVGGTYDAANDVFINKKPFNSWILDETTWLWKAPVDKPSDANDEQDTSLPLNHYDWNEETLSWDFVATYNYNSETEEWLLA